MHISSFNFNKCLYITCDCNCSIAELCDLIAGPNHGGREAAAHGCRNHGSDETLRQRSAADASTQRCLPKVRQVSVFCVCSCVCVHLHVHSWLCKHFRVILPEALHYEVELTQVNKFVLFFCCFFWPHFFFLSFHHWTLWCERLSLPRENVQTLCLFCPNLQCGATPAYAP